MFSFFKKNPAVSSLSILGADMHSHLLPGIDDGSPDIETSIALIKGLSELGIKKIITTPHVMWDMYKNERETILNKERLVNEELEKRGIETRVKAAAEYFLDDYFNSLIKSDAPLLTVYDNAVLTEFSFVSAPLNLQQTLFQMELKGYGRIIAHPERYNYFHNEKSVYHDFFDRGSLLQVNLLSLTGYYGKGPLEAAKYLIKNKMVSLFGTDMHHVCHLHALNNKDLFRTVADAMVSGEILNSQL